MEVTTFQQQKAHPAPRPWFLIPRNHGSLEKWGVPKENERAPNGQSWNNWSNKMK